MTTTPRDVASALDALEALHDSVDERARRLADRHAGRLRCGRGCSACCVDDISVFEVEAERIRRAHRTLLATEAPHPAGGCAFLDEQGSCRVYSERPYVCRTQGLPLRWLDDSSDEQLTEYRDICPENAEGPALETLPAEDCWLLGPDEAVLREIATRMGGGPPRRVALRALFGDDESR